MDRGFQVVLKRFHLRLQAQHSCLERGIGLRGQSRIDDRFIVDGMLDTAAMKPIARCGYDQYAVVESLFSMTRPSA